MTNEAHSMWALVAWTALMVILVVGCTASVAYFMNSAAGLWSLLIPLFTSIKFGSKQ